MRTLLLSILALTLAVPAQARLYHAALDQSTWQARPDGELCHLSHRIPLLGAAVFSSDGRDSSSLSVYTQRPPVRARTATVYSRNPAWKASGEVLIGEARLHPDAAMLRFGHFSSQRLLAELERGQMPVIRIAEWWDDQPAELALSPVGFQAGMRTFQQCLADLPSRSPDRPQIDPWTLMDYRATAAAKALDAPSPELREPTVIYFATDNAGLDRDAMDRIREFAEILRRHPHRAATVSTGHADARGGEAYNRALGERRARVVRDYLVEQGVAAERVSLTSAGARLPATRAEDRYAHAVNRRVVLELVDALSAAPFDR